MPFAPSTMAVIGAGVSAAGTIASTVGGLSAGGGAAASANALSEKTIAEARGNYERDRTTYQPFVDSGTGATTRSADLLGLNGADAAASGMAGFQASPGYGYALSEGLKGVDHAAASNGLLRSGATLKAEQTLGANLANQDFGAYMGRLNSLSGVGLDAAKGQAGSTSTFNALMSGQSSGQQQTTVGQGVNDASIYGNAASGLVNAAGVANKAGAFNGLFGNGNPQSSYGGSVGAAGSAGTNALQSMGFYNPIGAY